MALKEFDSIEADKNSVSKRNTDLGTILLADWNGKQIDRIDLDDSNASKWWWRAYREDGQGGNEADDVDEESSGNA